MRFRIAFQACLVLGAVFAVVGSGALAVCHLVDPEMAILPRVETAYRQGVFGFLFLSLFALTASLLDLFARLGRPPEAPLPEGAPVPAPAAEAPAAAPAPPRPALDALYHEMKTYIDLEMWELALEKANAVVKEHPGTPEAELVSRNLNEIRWKAEPKFVARQEPLSPDQEREFRERGLGAMLQHVKTYMDLGMWELARQKAVALMKGFPESPEAAELMRHFGTIQRKANETAEAGSKP
jgi:hypothetical protein